MADYVTKNGKIEVTEKVFKNQPLSLSAMPTGADLSSATAVVFKFEKPNGDRTSNTFTNAASIDSPASTGNVSCTIDANELDQVGTWKIWASVVDSNGTTPGTVIYLPVYEEGTA